VKPDDILQCASTEFLFRLHPIRKAGVKLAVGLLSAVPRVVLQYGIVCRNALLLDALFFGVNYYAPISRDDK
jgi:hypothetical protein